MERLSINMNSPALDDLAFPHLFKHEQSEFFILSADWHALNHREEAALTLLLQSKDGYHYLTHLIMDWDKDRATGKLYFVLDERHYVQIITNAQYHKWPIPLVNKDEKTSEIAAQIQDFIQISS